MSFTQPGGEYDSLDPKAGGTYRDKPIWDVSQIEENMNRSGYDWYTNNYGELDDGVLNFGFWKNIEELNNSYYVNETGTISFNEAYYSGDFSPFNTAQMDVARKAISLWADLIDVEFKETKSGDADLTYANTYTGGAQAYAYLPFGDVDDEIYSELYDFNETGRLGGDVWIDGFVASNFFPLTDSYYATTTMIHETGHALGLSHPGDYNAIGPDGEVLSPTYENQAEYAQDTLQYSIMSYFDGYETGAQFIDFQLLNFAYPSTPMVHDIAAIQAIYGANMETRTGDNVYGFNSDLVGTAYDFTTNTRPVISIWDAGGDDTIDFSGFKTPSTINLNEGSFSSGGGASRFYTLEEINEARVKAGFAVRTQATYDYYQDLVQQLGVKSPLFKDNISIAYGVTVENAVGGKGDDKIIVNSVANHVEGGRGNDTVSYETSETGVNVSLKNGATLTGGAAGDTLKSIESIIGSRHDDTLLGNKLANTLAGGYGDDVLIGQGGADTFVIRNENRSGQDTIRTFSKDDMIAVQTKLTGEVNGVIATKAGQELIIDASDGDSITLYGQAANAGLKLVGQANGFYYYAAANSTTVTADSIAKLAAPALTLDEVAAQTKAQLEAAAAFEKAQQGSAEPDLSLKVEGYDQAFGTRTGGVNTAFEQHVAFNDHDHGLVAANFAGSSITDANLVALA